MALGTSFTIQVNVVVDDVAFSPEAGAFSNMVVPIAYYKIVSAVSSYVDSKVTRPKNHLALQYHKQDTVI